MQNYFFFYFNIMSDLYNYCSGDRLIPEVSSGWGVVGRAHNGGRYLPKLAYKWRSSEWWHSRCWGRGAMTRPSYAIWHFSMHNVVPRQLGTRPTVYVRAMNLTARAKSRGSYLRTACGSVCDRDQKFDCRNRPLIAWSRLKSKARSAVYALRELPPCTRGCLISMLNHQQASI